MNDTNDGAPAVERELPDEPQPLADALAQFYKYNPGWSPRGYWRWRLLLDCGHITEVHIQGAGTLPLRTWHQLPEGHAACHAEGCRPEQARGAEYHAITEWKTRTATLYLDPDPVEPPGWVVKAAERGGTDPAEEWAQIRRAEPEPFASWQVTLFCGHTDSAVAPDNWKPEDGITYRIDAADEEQMARRAKILANPGIGESTRRDYEQMCPEPDLETACCYPCAWDRVIVAYERVGRLGGETEAEITDRRRAEFGHDHPEVEITYKGGYDRDQERDALAKTWRKPASCLWIASRAGKVIAAGNGLKDLLDGLEKLFGPTRPEQRRQAAAELERAEQAAGRLAEERAALQKRLTAERAKARRLRSKLAALDAAGT